MSLSRPAWPAGPARPVTSERATPPDDRAAASPSSKRRRLEEPAVVSEAGWPLLVVPRLSEVEKAWEWSPRPFTAFLVPKNPGISDTGRQRCGPAWQDRTFQRQSCWPSGLSGQAGGSGASGRSCEPGLQDREALGVCRGDQAEVSHFTPDTFVPGVQRVKHEPAELPDPGKETIPRGRNPVRQPGNPFLDVTFSEITKSTLHDIKDSCEVDGVITSEKKENDSSSSTLKMPKIQNQACSENAKSSYFRDNITVIYPEFPRDLNSNMSFVYLKEIAKKKNDKIVAYVRDFTNIFWSQNRPDAKKQKLQDDKKNVFVENNFSEYYETQHQSLTVEGKIVSVSLNYDHHRSIECDIRDTKKNFTLTADDANWEGRERNLDSFMLTRQEESQSWDYNRFILKRPNSWITKNCRISCETKKKLGENLNLVLSLEIDLLNKGDYHNAKVRNVHEQLLPTVGSLDTSPSLIGVVWFNGRGRNANILQLRYYTIQKHTCGDEDASTLTCQQMVTCEKEIDIQKIGILSQVLQNTISELLNIILKTNIVSLINSFDSFIRNGDDWDSEEGCIFKCIVHLNYLKNFRKESYIVYLTRTFISSRPLENNTKSMVKKRKLFKMEHVLEGAKRRNISSLTIATKSFPIYKLNENVPFVMNFDEMEGLSLAKEQSYKNTSCPQRPLNMENWTYCSFSIASTHVKSDTLLIQNNCGYISEKYCESSMYSQDLDIKRKQNYKTPHFIFKFLFEDAFNVRQLDTLLSQNIIHNEHMSAMAITQKLSLENLIGEIEWEIYDFILKKDVKVTESSSSCQAYKAMDIGKEEDSFPPIVRMSPVQLALQMSKNTNRGEMKSANQNTRNNTKEDRGILQEIKLANSKHFHPENDSTLYAVHQFESDSSGKNNECFQGSTVKCLSTETLPIATDFEMKSKFDLVLEELRMFHSISMENKVPSTKETNNRKENYFGESNNVMEARMEIEKDLEIAETNKKNAPTKTGPNKHKRYQGLFKWKTVPSHGGQAVPNECCRTSQEEFLHSTSEKDYKTSFPKSPAFFPDECKKEKYNYLLKGDSHFSQGISRVQPLKTCSGPIRVGLSRRARLKQLHPYLK